MSNSSHSFHFDGITTGKEQSKAVVVLLGWWGANIKNLSKYAELYRQRNCLTVQAIAQDFAVLTHNNRLLDECALVVASQTAKILRKLGDDKVPVIFHAFSNGGAYLVERLEFLVHEAREGRNHGEGNADLLLLGERLQGEIFDSAPAYPSATSAVKAMSSVFSNSVVLRALLSLLVTLHGMYDYILHNVFGYADLRKQFFKNMANSRICLKQAFIYSTADDITDFVRLKELIETRKQICDDVLVTQFDDSLHVQHLRMHPAAYNQVVDSFLKSIGTPTAIKTD